MSTAAEAHPGHVVLVGMMATGKSTVGEWLAARLGRPFLDSDRLIEARTGHTVKEIFAGRGEAGFRREESAALAESLAASAPVVIAAAGGAVLDPANRRLIRQAGSAGGLVVWLRAEPDELARRAASGSHRPLLDHDPLATLTRLAAVREPLYREVADLEIDETGPDGVLTTSQIGQRILTRVRPDGGTQRPASGESSTRARRRS